MLDFMQARLRVNRELEKYRFDQPPEELYEPIRYILSIGGKRMRPALTLMACNVFSDEVHRAIHPALAFEFFHNFTLLHDDLMDNSSLRRGKKTVHEKWNPNVALLSGDAMSILSYRILTGSGDPYLKDLLQLFNATALQVCEGQQWDMNFESRIEISLDEYLKMVELKTAVLIAACLKAGAITGGAGGPGPELLYEFGRNLGIAFQIRDDYLDVFGDPEVFGKRIGSDIQANKKTFLMVRAMELAEGNTKRELAGWYARGNHDAAEKTRRITEIFRSLKIDRISSELAGEYSRKAIQCLEDLEVSSERKIPLAEFARDMMHRQK